MIIDNMLNFSKEKITSVVRTGDIVIDCTVGNGYDTVFLSDLTGENGTVFGFDIQEKAIEATRLRLKENRCFNNVKLFHTGHENLKAILSESNMDKVSAVLFNLGYLPGTDKSVVTLPETTITALVHSLELIKKNGVVSIAVYGGHEGGVEESNIIDKWAGNLNKKEYTVLKYMPINNQKYAHHLLLIEKL